MQLPPCRPLLPLSPCTARSQRHQQRRTPMPPVARISPCGLRLNLNWVLNMLATVPGPHQQRISPRSSHNDPTPVEQHSSSEHAAGALAQQSVVTKEELGRATWTFLHTLAAQWPQHPTRQQQKDVTALVDVLTRIYPCRECAAHFKELVRQEPPAAKSQQELEQWMCSVHNSVNESLGKPAFNCRVAGLRWPAVDCGGADVCSLGAPGHGKT